ncbi:MAG TPA: ACT domain-containing protein [Oculatellaceae cyanobacterium]
MQQTVVITGVGRDRVGIVAELTTVLFKLGCNLLDSSMTLLRGEFAIILMTSLADGITIEKLKSELQPVQDKLDFQLQIRELSPEQIEASAGDDFNQKMCIISVYGADKPGIVSGITTKLANLQINITDVETTRTSQNPGGKSVFIMLIEAKLPASGDLQFIRSELKGTAETMGVDITVQELEVVDL